MLKRLIWILMKTEVYVFTWAGQVGSSSSDYYSDSKLATGSPSGAISTHCSQFSLYDCVSFFTEPSLHCSHKFFSILVSQLKIELQLVQHSFILYHFIQFHIVNTLKWSIFLMRIPKRYKCLSLKSLNNDSI